MVPLEPAVEWLRQLREEQPELPIERAKRYELELGLTPYDAGVLRSTKALGDLFEEALAAARKADASRCRTGSPTT